MDTLTRRDGNAFLSRWENEERPKIIAIKVAAIDLLTALERRWDRAYRAEETASLAAYAADVACGALDQINDIEGEMLKEADEYGVRAIAEENMLVDLLELQLRASLWKARAEARETRDAACLSGYRPQPQGIDLMTMHTQGPWTIEYPMGDDLHVIVQANKPTYEWSFIATITADAEDGRKRISKAEAKANAILIKAAPQMLATLERVERWIEQGGAVSPLDDVHAVIAAARDSGHG